MTPPKKIWKNTPLCNKAALAAATSFYFTKSISVLPLVVALKPNHFFETYECLVLLRNTFKCLSVMSQRN